MQQSRLNAANERNIWVDYAKAIGIILVVYGHVARGVFNAGIPFDESVYHFFDSVIYTFHMPLFFFLSGLFFTHSFEKWGGRGLLINKIDTIVYPLVLWSIIQGAIEVYLSNYTNGNLSYSEVFTVLWAPRAHFWFLYALFVLFVFTTLLYSLLPRKVLTIALALTALGYLFQSSLSVNIITGYINNNMVFFAFGILFSNVAPKRDLGSTPVLLTLAILFVGLQYVFHQVMGLSFEDKGPALLVLALVSILFVVSLSARLSRTQLKWLIRLGASSMGIYLMHVLAGSGVRVMLKSFLGNESLSAHLLAGCLAGLLVPVVVMMFINKYNIPFVISAPVSRLLVRKKKIGPRVLSQNDNLLT